MGERGQAVVEFALVSMFALMMTVGLAGVGVGFYQYNAVSDLARYGARWGGVVGGACALPTAVSTSDFCNQQGNSTQNFWNQPGNAPLQGTGVACPSYSSAPSDYYNVGSYVGSSTTTIAASVAQHWDTTSSSAGFLASALSVGFNLSHLYICIATSASTALPGPGSSVSVTLYYSFSPVSQLLTTNVSIPFSAASQYQVE